MNLIKKRETFTLKRKTDDNDGLIKIRVGLGWDVNEPSFFQKLLGNYNDYDLDAFAIQLNEQEALHSFVYYGNLTNENKSIVHMGDNLTGEGKGDDETIIVDLTNIPSRVKTITFGVNIYQAASRHQKFGDVKNAYIRILDDKTGAELVRYNLSDDYTDDISVMAGKIQRENAEWVFTAVGDGLKNTLQEIVNNYK
jgi:tellurium resistance protein TerD